MTWEDELNSYLTYLRSKGTSMNYLNNATSSLRHLGRRFKPDSYLGLIRDDFVTWFDELRNGGITGKKGLADATMNTTAGQVKACLRWLNDGETPKSLRGLGNIGRRRSRVEAEGDLLTDSEFQRLLRVMTPDKRVLFRLLRATGARPAEVLGLRQKDTQVLEHDGRMYAEVTFRNTKTGTHRTVPIGNPTIVRELRDHLETADPDREALLFPSPKGKGQPMVYGSLHSYLRKKAKAVGIPKRVYPYMFRHMRATELLDAPRPIADRLMGWKGGTMWKNYTHLATDDLRDHVLEEAGPREESLEERVKRAVMETWEHVSRDPNIETLSLFISLVGRDEPLHVAIQQEKDQSSGGSSD